MGGRITQYLSQASIKGQKVPFLALNIHFISKLLCVMYYTPLLLTSKSKQLQVWLMNHVSCVKLLYNFDESNVQNHVSSFSIRPHDVHIIKLWQIAFNQTLALNTDYCNKITNQLSGYLACIYYLPSIAIVQPTHFRLHYYSYIKNFKCLNIIYKFLISRVAAKFWSFPRKWEDFCCFIFQ